MSVEQGGSCGEADLGPVADAPGGGMIAPPAPPPSLLHRLWDPLPFVLVHLGALAVVWTGLTWRSFALFLGLYLLRMWGMAAGYHRYFAHRSFKTSRAFQLVLAIVAQTGSQRGVLWWAAHHRVHHKHGDATGDPHSPVTKGFWYGHSGWVFDGNDATRWEQVQDLARYPELVWLDRHWMVPPAALAVVCLIGGGLPGLCAFFASTIAVWHGTFLVNSLAHLAGTRRFATRDQSRNHWLVALLTLGDGWHNNHHHYPSSARAGFYWWEFDVTWYVLRALDG
jgi:stearoyl-CoA desaturase (delta-9 desaturase)